MDSTSTSGPKTAAVGPRLAPDDRRRHLLEVARRIVEAEGVAAVSLEKVAAEAGVSRALLYTYFDNRPGLIRALWDEVASLWDVDPMPPYEGMLQGSTLRELFDRRLEDNTRWYLDQIEQSGLLFHRLMSEPHVEVSIDDARKRVERNNIEWWARLVEAMGIDAERAQVFSTLVNSSSQSMWGLVARGEVRREVIEELFFVSVRATLDALLVDCDCRPTS